MSDSKKLHAKIGALRSDLNALQKHVEGLTETLQQVPRPSDSPPGGFNQGTYDRGREKWKFRFEVVGIITALGLGVLTYLQFREMKQSTKAANEALRQSVESFRIDERAWIEIEPVQPRLRVPSDGVFPAMYAYDIYPKNLGKTSAYDVVMRAEAFSSGGEFGEQKEWIANIQDKKLFGKFVDNTGAPLQVKNTPVPKVLAPGVRTPVPFTFHGGTPDKGMYSYLVGRIDYADAFGVQHWMKFCFFVTDRDGALRNCSAGNDEDRNPEMEPSATK